MKVSDRVAGVTGVDVELKRGLDSFGFLGSYLK